MKLFGNGTASQRLEMLKNIPIFHELTRKEILEVDELLVRTAKPALRDLEGKHGRQATRGR